MSVPITCHVLNTLSGTPASNLATVLTLLEPPPLAGSRERRPTQFSATTNEDGRVTEWEPEGSKTLQEIFSEYQDGERIAWSINFQVGPWYEAQGIESFWPEVEVKFYVTKGQRHYHVPILVGPWTYTTYRGS